MLDGDNTVVVRVHEHHREFGLAFNYQGNWSGLYLGVELTATGETYLRQCTLNADAHAACLRLTIEPGGAALPAAPLLRVVVRPVDGGSPVAAREIPLPADGQVEIPVPDPRLWSPDTPALYRVDVALARGEEILDAFSERTGFVSLQTVGKQFRINDEPYYLRGTRRFHYLPGNRMPGYRPRALAAQAAGAARLRLQLRALPVLRLRAGVLRRCRRDGIADSERDGNAGRLGRDVADARLPVAETDAGSTIRCSSASGIWWCGAMRTIPRPICTA